MHHGTCITHVPWCKSGSLTHGSRENIPGIPAACTTRNSTYLATSDTCASKHGVPYDIHSPVDLFDVPNSSFNCNEPLIFQTRLFVTNSLSFIDQADHIVVLNHGEICESGTFSNLVSQQGPFGSLLHEQLNKKTETENNAKNEDSEEDIKGE